MSNTFQSAILVGSSFTKQTASIVPAAGKVIALSVFSEFNIAAFGGWQGTPAGWAGVGFNANSNGMLDVVGVPLTFAGPMTSTDPSNVDWAALLLMFAANANFGIVGWSANTGGFVNSGAVPRLMTIDVPAGSTMIAIGQGCRQFFSDAAKLASVSDSVGTVWSPVVSAFITDNTGHNVCQASAAVAINVPHIPANTNVVTYVNSVGGNNSTLGVLVVSGIISMEGSCSGSML